MASPPSTQRSPCPPLGSSGTTSQPASSAAWTCEILQRGRFELLGEIPWSSNVALLVRLRYGQDHLTAVYKPRRGERPLWDFPTGTLCQREVAAYELSEILAWELVPPTVFRNGPLGPGAVQRFVPHDPQVHYLAMNEVPSLVLARIVAFDVIANNADRKSGHVLRDPSGHIWLIDHGLTFHVDWKLRTVVWELEGEPLPPAVRDDLSRLASRMAEVSSGVRRRLGRWLASAEIEAIAQRTEGLLSAGRFPRLDRYRRAVPWPPV